MAKKKMTRSEMFKAAAEWDLKVLTYHEAAHYVVAHHFGAKSNFMVWRNPNGGYDQKFWIGNHKVLSRSPFQNSCIGWAGILAEDLANEQSPESIDAQAVFDYFDFDTWEKVSENDRKSIQQHHQIWRTCKCAEGILLRRFDELTKIVEEALATMENDHIFYGEDPWADFVIPTNAYSGRGRRSRRRG